MANRNQTQQGDVWFEQVDKLPPGVTAIPRENGLLILAKGEATGHHHAVAERGANLYQLKTPEGVTELYLEVTAPQVSVDHQEHHAQLKATGIYRIGQKREKDWLTEMERRVID